MALKTLSQNLSEWLLKLRCHVTHQNSFEMTSSIEDYVKPEDLVRATSNDTDLGRLRADGLTDQLSDSLIKWQSKPGLLEE